jgi:gas vesicle protein
MSDTGKFWRGVLLGALAGGALSLLDKPTRDAVMTNCRRTGRQVTNMVRNPSVMVDKVRNTSEQMRQTVEQVSDDLFFIKEKVEELSEVTPKVVDIVKETKDVFSDNGVTYSEADRTLK